MRVRGTEDIVSPANGPNNSHEYIECTYGLYKLVQCYSATPTPMHNIGYHKLVHPPSFMILQGKISPADGKILYTVSITHRGFFRVGAHP